jgi:hypothetical protein
MSWIEGECRLAPLRPHNPERLWVVPNDKWVDISQERKALWT